MRSTFGVLPAHSGVVSGIPIPISVTVEPLSVQGATVACESKIPRCSRCRAYVSSVCAVSPEAWCCSVCSQIMHLQEPVNKTILENNCIEVIQSAEEEPLNHVLMIFTPISKDVIRSFLELLPERAPLTIVSKEVTPTASVSLILEELDQIELPEFPIPFEQAVDKIIESFSEFMTPCWIRVFMETPAFDLTDSPLLNFVREQCEKDVRMDFYFSGTSFGPLLKRIIKHAPGLCKVFHPITEEDMPTHLLSESTREFAMQLHAVFRPGIAYTAHYMKSRFLSTIQCENYIKVPVVPSVTTPLMYNISVPQNDTKMRTQAMQCVVKYQKWNAKTNRLSRIFRIISHEFRISNNLTALLESVSPSSLFHFWLNQAQNLPQCEMAASIQKNLRELAPVIAANRHMKSIIPMAFLSKSHLALSTADWDRLTMGASLSLTSPASIGTYFSYAVELWRSCDEFVESVFSVDESKRTGEYIYVVKSFPSLVILTESGRVDIPEGSNLDKSIGDFLSACKPLPVKVVQSALKHVAALLAVDEEEGLEGYLEEADLQDFHEDLM